MLVSRSDVKNALEAVGYHPISAYLTAIVEEANNSFDDIIEAVMFLAQTTYETDGFRYIEEIAYAGSDKIATEYGEGEPGKSYHGRGFFQLLGPNNYRNASSALGMGDRLYKNPELVSEDLSIAAKVSSWYWRDTVRPMAGPIYQFGLTTKAIKETLEHRRQTVDESKDRCKIYIAIARATGLPGCVIIL
ncbi:acidic endochitinase SP2-like [Polistes fuscatus]|uniref:acidic endochitinase SP2-like n=1 Tax=Polistes fuscatus TaxID=30207 RepID=UPI001CA89314|nr:acidic endochitinase SP2-like [Polistes fuscatus]